MSPIETRAVVKESRRIISEAQRPRAITLPAATIYHLQEVVSPLIEADASKSLHKLHGKLIEANSGTAINRHSSVSLSGQEIDFLTRQLVPYETPREKAHFISEEYWSHVKSYKERNAHASDEDAGAYAQFLIQRTRYTQSAREKSAAELHQGFEAAGGGKRDSFIIRQSVLMPETKRG